MRGWGALLLELGVEESVCKACPPATSQTVLGTLINTLDMTISVTPDRLVSTKELLHTWQGRSRCTKTELRSLLGKLCCIIRCVRQSRVFMNRLLAALRSFGHDKYISVSAEFKKDVHWWSTFMAVYNGVSIIPPIRWTAPDVVFTTDSTLSGCGGLTDIAYFHRRYPDYILDAGYSINALEILAVTVSVRLWGHMYGGQKILIYCDNEVAVQAINTGKTRDSFVGSCARQLWLEIANFGFELKAVHLPGVENRLADSLSRWHMSPYYSNLFLQAVEGISIFEKHVDDSLFLLDESL